MSKVIPAKISKKERNQLKKLLCKKVAKLKNESQVINFLSDLLTESEFIMIIRRLEIAKMLLDEKTYYEIKTALNVSPQTIQTVREKLNKSLGGYLNFIKHLKV